MKKFLIGWISTILMLSQIAYGGATLITDFWNSEEKMSLYYRAISQVTKTLTAIAEEVRSPVEGEFIFQKEPEPARFRSPKYLFLEKEGELLSRLYTPFGGIGLGGGMEYTTLKIVSERFMARMEGVVEDVTARIHYYTLVVNEDGTEEQTPHLSQPSQDPMPKQRSIFLIRSVGEYLLMNKSTSPAEELVLFPNVILFTTQSQHSKDKALFEKLSDGKNSF